MSQENVEAFKRAVDAGNRGDVEAGLLQELDPEVERHPVLLTSLEAEATVYRGHDGVREWFRTMSGTFRSAVSCREEQNHFLGCCQSAPLRESGASRRATGSQPPPSTPMSR